MTSEALEALMFAETEIALDAVSDTVGEKPLTLETIRTLALVLIAKRLGTLANAIDGDVFTVNAFDAGKT